MFFTVCVSPATASRHNDAADDEHSCAVSVLCTRPGDRVESHPVHQHSAFF